MEWEEEWVWVTTNGWCDRIMKLSSFRVKSALKLRRMKGPKRDDQECKLSKALSYGACSQCTWTLTKTLSEILDNNEFLFCKMFFLRSHKRNSWKEKLMKTDWAISNLQMTRVFEKTRRNFQMAPQVTSPKTRCVKTPRYAFHPLSFQATKRKKVIRKANIPQFTPFQIHSFVKIMARSIVESVDAKVNKRQGWRVWWDHSWQ